MKSRRQFAILGLFLLAGISSPSQTSLTPGSFRTILLRLEKSWAEIFSVVWGREHGGFFRPLFILSYLIDTKIWGARPFGFHLTNVVFHSLNAFLTFVLSLRLVEDLKADCRHKANDRNRRRRPFPLASFSYRSSVMDLRTS